MPPVVFEAVLLAGVEPIAFRRGANGFDDGRAEVTLDEPREAIAPGQACVFYDGPRVLGGGWIEPA